MSKTTMQIYEVGPRDGLQNEADVVGTNIIVELIQKLHEAGLVHIEAGAFVSPKWVPQMAHSEEVIQGVQALQHFHQFSALTPNMKGYEKAKAVGLKEISVFTAASTSFTKHNINATIDESLQRFEPILKQAKIDQIKVRGYVSCAFHCPYEGFIDPYQVIPVCQELIQMGCYQVSLGDTTGRASPLHIERLIKAMDGKVPLHLIAGHFHDTFGQALANVYKAYQMGVRVFDTSVGGLGGCPYSPGASGNLATEDCVFMFENMGIETGIDLEHLCQTADWIARILRPDETQSLKSKVGQALLAQQHNFAIIPPSHSSKTRA